MDEDTIEIELTGEQELGLSQVAKTAQATARPAEAIPGLPSPAFGSIVRRRTARIDFICGVTFAVAGVGITAATVWHPADRNTTAPTAMRAAPIVRPPAVPAEQQGAIVQVRNPFDAAEVFEFPAETTKTEAREAMAELLLQRARNRYGQRLGIKHAGGRDPTRNAASERSDVLVTNLSGHPIPAK
jgi:hypothetical protein